MSRKLNINWIWSKTCTLFDMFLFVLNFLIHKAFLYIVWILKTCKYLPYRVNTRCACICIYPSQYVCVYLHIYFVFAFASIQVYVLSTYIHVIYMYIHVFWHAFGHVYLSWSCRFFFFFITLSLKTKAHSFAILPLAGSFEHLLRRITIEVVHVIHCVK